MKNLQRKTADRANSIKVVGREFLELVPLFCKSRFYRGQQSSLSLISGSNGFQLFDALGAVRAFRGIEHRGWDVAVFHRRDLLQDAFGRGVENIDKR